MNDDDQESTKNQRPTPDTDALPVAAKAALDQFMAKIQAGICPRCDHLMTLEQRGPDVYAIPCDHRLYRGHLP